MPEPPPSSPLPPLPSPPRDFADRAFKQLMSDRHNLRDLVNVAAESYASLLDCLNASAIPTELIVSEVPDWPKGISDTIFEVPIRDDAGRPPFPLSIKVVEHQSKAEEDVVFRSF